MSDRSSYLNLYSAADVSDDSKKARMAVGDSEIDFSAAQEMKFDFGAYKFKKSDGTYFALQDRFAVIEGSTASADNQGAIIQLQQDLAAEITARTSGDTANGNLISSETTARTSADQSLQAALDAEIVAARDAEFVNASAIQQETTDRVAAVAAEASRAQAAEASLQSQITNILSNTDAAAIDSLSEVVGQLNNLSTEDANLLSLISTLTTDLDILKSRVDALTAA